MRGHRQERPLRYTTPCGPCRKRSQPRSGKTWLGYKLPSFKNRVSFRRFSQAYPGLWLRFKLGAEPPQPTRICTIVLGLLSLMVTQHGSKGRQALLVYTEAISKQRTHHSSTPTNVYHCMHHSCSCIVLRTLAEHLRVPSRIEPIHRGFDLLHQKTIYFSYSAERTGVALASLGNVPLRCLCGGI